jgi:periplasmic divalent cation tolerance protein
MRLVIVTAPRESAASIARTIIKERLAACVNIVPEIRSIYAWEGKIEDDEEALMLLKTTAEQVAGLVARVRELHPHDVPEIIALDLNKEHSNPAYLDWVQKVVGP